MAPSQFSRPNTLRISACALAALSLAPATAPLAAQAVYREYDDGTVETLPGDDQDLSVAPLRRPPPRAFDDEDEERFEREDDDEDFDDDQDQDDRQGTLDLTPAPGRKAPVPPPSVDAKPDDKAWKPAL